MNKFRRYTRALFRLIASRLWRGHKDELVRPHKPPKEVAPKEESARYQWESEAEERERMINEWRCKGVLFESFVEKAQRDIERSAELRRKKDESARK